MNNQQLSETIVRQQSEKLNISFENLLAAIVLEKIVLKLAESEYVKNFWMKNSCLLNLENYRTKVNRSISYYIKESSGIYYKKTNISNVFSKTFRNYKKEAIHWNYNLKEKDRMLYVSLTATIFSVKIPFIIELQPITDKNLNPDLKEIFLATCDRKIEINCFPSECILVEKFLEIMDKLELINDLSGYIHIYEILRKEALSGRRVWELLYERCKEHGIAIEEERLELLLSYRNNKYMRNKWKIYLRHEKRKEPDWENMIGIIDKFFSVIWENMCQNTVYLGDWIPDLQRFID